MTWHSEDTPQHLYTDFQPDMSSLLVETEPLSSTFMLWSSLSRSPTGARAHVGRSSLKLSPCFSNSWNSHPSAGFRTQRRCVWCLVILEKGLWEGLYLLLLAAPSWYHEPISFRVNCKVNQSPSHPLLYSSLSISPHSLLSSFLLPTQPQAFSFLISLSLFFFTPRYNTSM